MLSATVISLSVANEGENRGSSLVRKRHPLGPCSWHMRRALWRSQGGGGVL